MSELRETGGGLNMALSDMRLRAPITATPETPLRGVLETMSRERIGSMLVVDAEGGPAGIFTLNDLLNRVALPELSQDAPVGAAMTPDPVRVPRTALAVEAALTMAETGIRHLVVVEDGRPVGVVSERDLFAVQRVGLVSLSKSFGAAESVAELARDAAGTHALVGQMMEQGVKVRHVARIITAMNDMLAVRAIELVIAESGGSPPLPFTWLAFGSEGRCEQTLKTDQDNGILFEVPAGMSADAAREMLLPFAERVNEALAECGFPLCPGNIMARNPDCCLSLEEWHDRFARWIDQGTPEHLLNAAIFFDFRPLYGPEAPAEALRDALTDQAATNGRFRKQMAANALRSTPALGGMFRRFRLDGDGTLDLKSGGVTPFIDAGRIFALAGRVRATSTTERLEEAAAAGVLQAERAASWHEAYDYLRMLRMRLNHLQAAAGQPLSNRLDPRKLVELDRSTLHEALREGRELQRKIALDYQL